MPIFLNGRGYVASIDRRLDKTVRMMKTEHQHLAEALKRDAKELTSGGISSDQLAAMGHPFGRGRGRRMFKAPGRGATRYRAKGDGRKGYAPLLPINRQTGRLYRSWTITRVSGGIQSFQIGPAVSYARYVLAVGGTKRMVARGFWSAMKRKWKSRNKQLLYEIRLRQLRIMLGQG